MNKIWNVEEVRKLLAETGEKMGFDCAHVPVEVSSRMEKTMGSFLFREKEGIITAHAFRFAQVLLSGYYHESVVRNVILHEYAHFYANVKDNRNHKHDAYFKKVCEELGIPTHTYFKELLPRNKKNGYILVCSKCGSKVAARRKVDSVNMILKSKVSGCCHAKIRAKKAVF